MQMTHKQMRNTTKPHALFHCTITQANNTFSQEHTTECNQRRTIFHLVTSHMLPFNVFCLGPGIQAKCTVHPQMPSAASHPFTIQPHSCNLYLTLPSISKKHLQVFFVKNPLPRCISAWFLLLEIKRQCTPQNNVSFSPAITWKIEVHLPFVVIDI
jgi:hypothetical protein